MSKTPQQMISERMQARQAMQEAKAVQDEMRHGAYINRQGLGAASTDMLGSLPLVPLNFMGEIQQRREQLEAVNVKNREAIDAYAELLQYLDTHPEVDEMLNKVHIPKDMFEKALAALPCAPLPEHGPDGYVARGEDGELYVGVNGKWVSIRLDPTAVWYIQDGSEK